MKDRTKKFLIRLVIVTILVVIGVVYYMSDVRDFSYQGYDTNTSNLQRFDAELNEAIVLTRFGRIKYYDPIVNALNSEERVIKNFKAKLEKYPNAEINEKLKRLEEAVTEKRHLTEQFKRINPVLNNAITQFSTILSNAIESEANTALIEGFQEPTSPGDQQTGIDLEEQLKQTEKKLQIDKANDLFRGILIYISHRTEEKYQTLVELVEEIEKAPAESKLPRMDLVLNYARKILELQPQMTAIDAELFQIPVVQRLQHLNESFEEAEEDFRNQGEVYRYILYILIFTMLSLLRWTFARLQNTVVALHAENKQRMEAQEALAEINRELENRVAQRTQELTVKNSELSQTMSELKEAQDQLIIKEKMASVGMLTTGIAHEIKNPLNFVNNFSEISIDLVSELNDELESKKEKLGTDDLSYIQDILGDLKTNCTKIKEHGVRADNIVKMMLMHSQETGVQKEMINLHNLLEDNVRIAIETFTAAQGKFEVVFDKQLDASIDEILAAPQTLGRAFIYIIDNSLYAMKEQKAKSGPDYIPTLSITTQKVNEYVEIKIQDNGTGIPKQSLDKVFEPFFTTKPTGKGNTGLGLSICYDTVVKQHKGELSVISEEGKYTVFTVKLPIKPTTTPNT